MMSIKQRFSLKMLFVSCMFIHMFKSVFFKTILCIQPLIWQDIQRNSVQTMPDTVVPSGLGMHGPLAGSCVRCGCGAVCREGKAAADRTYNRTVVSPGHAPDRSEPVDKSQIKSQLKHFLPQGRKIIMTMCVYTGPAKGGKLFI